MSDDEPSFIFDTTGDITATRILDESDAAESDSSSETTRISKRQAKRVRREERAKQLETFLFGDNLKTKIESTDESKAADEKNKPKKTAAWIDDDDEVLAEEALKTAKKYPKKVVPEQKYQSYLLDKFNNIYGKPKWVEKAEDNKTLDSDSDDDQIIGFAGDLKTESTRLQPDTLKFSKCASITLQLNLKGVVTSLQFHPSLNLALGATTNGHLNLYQVDGETNANLQNVCFDNFIIDRARFGRDAKDVIVGSKVPLGYFYSYDMIKGQSTRIPLIQGKEKLALRDFVLSPDKDLLASRGKVGSFYLITMKSRELIATFKLNENAHGLCFSKDGQRLFTHSDDGAIYVYDIRNAKRCYHRFIDEGSLGGRSLIVSPNQGYLTTGDQSGLINVYKYDSIWQTENPKPLRSVQNIKTSIECLKFNHTSELLGVSSGFANNAVRMIHFPTISVFSNFPIPHTEYKRITELDISPNSGYMAMANHLGSAFLFRLNHFIHY